MDQPMRVLMIGAGGVGDAAARIAIERDFFEAWVVADHDPARAERTVDALWDTTGKLIDAFKPDECANYFKAAGYEWE